MRRNGNQVFLYIVDWLGLFLTRQVKQNGVMYIYESLL